MIPKAMLKRLKSLIAGRSGGADSAPAPAADADELNLAVAVLLVEAARMDEDFGPEERATIAGLLEERLSLPAEEARELMASADEVAEEMGDLWSFARVVKDRFSEDERIGMIEMLWDVAYADGELHHYEANLLRRIAGLIYVSDRDSGLARKRTLQRLELPDRPSVE